MARSTAKSALGLLIASLTFGGCLLTSQAYQTLAKPDRRPRIEQIVECRATKRATSIDVAMILRLTNGRAWLAETTFDGRSKNASGHYTELSSLADGASCTAQVRSSQRFAVIEVVTEDEYLEAVVPLPRQQSATGHLAFFALLPVWLAVDVVTAPVQIGYVVSQLPNAH